MTMRDSMVDCLNNNCITKTFFTIWFYYKPLSLKTPPVTKGGISLYNVHFGNFWKIGPDWGNNAGKWAFNRDGLAIDLNCPLIKPKETLHEIISTLNEWAAKNEKQINALIASQKGLI